MGIVTLLVYTQSLSSTDFLRCTHTLHAIDLYREINRTGFTDKPVLRPVLSAAASLLTTTPCDRRPPMLRMIVQGRPATRPSGRRADRVRSARNGFSRAERSRGAVWINRLVARTRFRLAQCVVLCGKLATRMVCVKHPAGPEGLCHLVEASVSDDRSLQTTHQLAGRCEGQALTHTPKILFSASLDAEVEQVEARRPGRERDATARPCSLARHPSSLARAPFLPRNPRASASCRRPPQE